MMSLTVTEKMELRQVQEAVGAFSKKDQDKVAKAVAKIKAICAEEKEDHIIAAIAAVAMGEIADSLD